MGRIMEKQMDNIRRRDGNGAFVGFGIGLAM